MSLSKSDSRMCEIIWMLSDRHYKKHGTPIKLGTLLTKLKGVTSDSGVGDFLDSAYDIESRYHMHQYSESDSERIRLDRGKYACNKIFGKGGV